ncbi:MAG: hypothetical protein H6733_12845 [Alphaproteobacteria bacterium]|nr:hypothetical protein [Alphaproteobacteria bacterium]
MHRFAVAAAASLAVLTGCKGLEENDFIVDYELLHCDAYVICASDEMTRAVQMRECMSFLRNQAYPSPPECGYDAEAAETCISDLQLVGCDGVDPEYPDSCLEVYSQCPYPRMPVVGDNRRL